jgi:hypothetical protein
MRLFFHKLTHWEYWPFFPVYFPVILQWIYHSIRARSIFFFNASNPTIKNGGFMAESKKEIYSLIPQQYYPKTELVAENTVFPDVISILEQSGIKFPLIAKPNIGLRGSGVKKIHDLAELANYHSRAHFDFLIQDLIPYENEFGIFYVRYPHQKKGRITGVVGKEFLIVEGDGKSTIEELIKQNPRYELQLKSLRREYGKQLMEVLQTGEKKNLVPYGNHARGAKFIDETGRVTEKLTDLIDGICQQVPGFYFGRLDVMYSTFDELERGENFLLVELNGAASEPTHIYDPKHSIFFAWQELLRHNRYMFEISVANHKTGAPYLPHKVGMAQYRIHLENNKKILSF